VDEYIKNPKLQPPNALHPAAKTPVDHPVVIKQDGELYLHDGHHRATARWLQGAKTVDARLVNFDKE
jgi:hypothetical protein